MPTRKPKKSYFDNYPLRDKIGKANFTLKLKNGGDSLRFTPEQFGNGLNRHMRMLIRDATHQVLNGLQMQELQFLSKEDRMTHINWVIAELERELQEHAEGYVDSMKEFY